MNQGWTYQEKVNSQGASQTLLDDDCQRYQPSLADEGRDRILAGQILINPCKVYPRLVTNFNNHP